MFFFHFLEVELAQSKDVSFFIVVVIPPPLGFRINMSKVLLFSSIVRLRWVPVCVSCRVSGGPNKFSLMKQICQSNPEWASATWISSVKEHLDGPLVVLIDDHCQASVEVLTILVDENCLGRLHKGKLMNIFKTWLYNYWIFLQCLKNICLLKVTSRLWNTLTPWSSKFLHKRFS